MSKPRIIVEVIGGMVQVVYADCAVDVDVLDYDKWEAEDEDSRVTKFYECLEEEAKTMHEVW